MVKKLWTLIKIWWTNSLIERGDMFLFTLTMFTTPLVIMLVWLTINKSGANTVLSFNQLEIYFLASMIVKTIASSWFGIFLSSRIRRGAISPHLTRPMPYIVDPIANNISEKLLS